MSAPVTGYPRWQGETSRAPRFLAVAANETRRAWNDQWARSALIIAFGYAVIALGSLYTASQSRSGVLTTDFYLEFLNILRWAALGVAAVMGGVALLDDAKKGALELYLSRSMTRWGYLAGKVLAVLALTFATVFVPALLFYVGAFLIIEDVPATWGWVILGAAGYALLWAFLVTGLGLGISCVVRSTRAATILIFAGIAGLDIVLGDILSMITKSDTLQLFSPMSQLDQQATWLFNVDAPFDFPWWWGLLAFGGLAALGWGLLYTRHPRLKGVE